MLYFVVIVVQGQRIGILCGEGLCKSSEILHYDVSVGKGHRHSILCGEFWEWAA
jgi:hypothetical protein